MHNSFLVQFFIFSHVSVICGSDFLSPCPLGLVLVGVETSRSSLAADLYRLLHRLSQKTGFISDRRSSYYLHYSIDPSNLAAPVACVQHETQPATPGGAKSTALSVHIHAKQQKFWRGFVYNAPDEFCCFTNTAFSRRDETPAGPAGFVIIIIDSHLFQL